MESTEYLGIGEAFYVKVNATTLEKYKIVRKGEELVLQKVEPVKPSITVVR